MRPHNICVELGEPDSVEFTWLLVRRGAILHIMLYAHIGTGQAPFKT